jgi:putative transposase
MRDKNDLHAHADYINYNAVRHGLVTHPSEWEHSSFKSYVDSGAYPSDWGAAEPRKFDGDFGD